MYKRGDVRTRPWVAVAPARYVTDSKTGKVKAVRERLGSFATAREAKDALEEFRRAPTTKVNITFAGVYEEWSEIAFRTISKQTKDDYTVSYAKFSSVYNETFRDLWTGQYQAVIDYYSAPFPAAKDDGSPKLDSTGHLVMSKPLSFSSLSKMKALLTQMYDYAMQNDIIHKNYATFLTLPKQEKVPKDCFTEQELQRIKSAVASVPHADSFRRRFYFPALEKMGIRRLTPHAACHTFATRLSAAGARAEDIQALAGHEDYEMTANKYIHQDIATLQRAIEKMS